MQVKLLDDERRAIINAIDIARIFYEKTKRKEEYFEVDDLSRLLFFADEIIADLNDDRVT